MGHVRDPLLRPARSARGVRPAARRRGVAAHALARALVLALALAELAPTSALADTLSVAQYQQRLEQAHDMFVRARGAPATSRGALLSDAQALLRRTDALTLPSGGTLAVDDVPLADAIDTSDAALDAAVARINARITLVARIGRPAIDPAAADARLRQIVAETGAAGGNTDLLDALGRLILRFVSGLRGPSVDLTQIWPLVGTLGLAVILFIIATLGRALPERVRREVLVRGGAGEERADPAAHLRAADAALSAARPREAIHAFFLYVIAALSTREAIRYDPALTDRELLVRAAAIPHADALRDLVAIYERSWFGLREPSTDEARRARDLALRVAP